MQLSGTEVGKQGYISVFQAAVTKFMETLNEDAIAKLEEIRANWLSWGQPCQLQRKAAEKMGRNYLQQSSKVQLNSFEMQSIVFEFHENQAGTKFFQMCLSYLLENNRFCRHDFNDSLGKVKLQSFWDKFPDTVASFQTA